MKDVIKQQVKDMVSYYLVLSCGLTEMAVSDSNRQSGQHWVTGENLNGAYCQAPYRYQLVIVAIFTQSEN
jgi:hypothetical protein